MSERRSRSSAPERTVSPPLRIYGQPESEPRVFGEVTGTWRRMRSGMLRDEVDERLVQRLEHERPGFRLVSHTGMAAHAITRATTSRAKSH